MCRQLKSQLDKIKTHSKLENDLKGIATFVCTLAAMQIQNANSTTTKIIINSIFIQQWKLLVYFFSKLGFLVKTMCLVLASFQEEVHWMCSTIHFREETSIHHSKEEATRYRSFLKATELRLSTKLTSIFAHIASTDVGCNNGFYHLVVTSQVTSRW